VEQVNTGTELLTGQMSLNEFVEQHYLPWCEQNKAAATTNGYRKVWERHWKKRLGGIALVNLTTAQITAVLTGFAKQGLGSRTL
jgi:hypothetical protein